MRGDMQVRFGGRYGKTYCRKAVRRSVPSLRLARSGDIIDLGILIYRTNDISRVLKLIENATPGVPVKARTFLPSSEERNETLRNIQIGTLTSVALKSYLDGALIWKSESGNAGKYTIPAVEEPTSLSVFLI